MNLKTITLVAAIAQSLSLLAHMANYSSYVVAFVKFGSAIGRLDDVIYIVSQPIHFIAQATLALFLFFLYSNQKDN